LLPRYRQGSRRLAYHGREADPSRPRHEQFPTFGEIPQASPCFAGFKDLISLDREVAPQKRREFDMPIWQLTPIDLDDPSWEASSHRGPAIIRAASEGAAREIAQEAFGVKTGFRLGHGIIAPPWKRAGLVRAEKITDPRYEENGPSELLSPTFES
jgi:hypothetical protein